MCLSSGWFDASDPALVFARSIKAGLTCSPFNDSIARREGLCTFRNASFFFRLFIVLKLVSNAVHLVITLCACFLLCAQTYLYLVI